MQLETDLQQAIQDPASRFGTPGEVVRHAGFTRAQKIAILRSWEYEESELAVAEEEGMPGRQPPQLRQVMLALDALDAGPLGERSSPTKHRGIPSP